MSKDDLMKAAAETPVTPAPDAKPDPANPTQEIKPPDPQAVAMMSGMWAMVVGIACERFGVSPLSQEEAVMLGTASVQVMDLYLPSMDPKTAAWMALGGGVMAVAGPRYLEYQRRHDAPPEPSSGDDGPMSFTETPAPSPTKPPTAKKAAPKRKTAAKSKRS